MEPSCNWVYCTRIPEPKETIHSDFPNKFRGTVIDYATQDFIGSVVGGVEKADVGWRNFKNG
jgi:hypothetical protein